MRSVWRLRNVTIASLLVLAALLALLARGADEAKANFPFNPTLGTVLTPNTPSTPADITSTLDWDNALPTRQFPESVAVFTPPAWGMPAADTPFIPIGTQTGTSPTLTTLGLLNASCASPFLIPLSFTLLDASTNPADSIPPGAGFANLIADVDNGVGIYPSGVSNGVFDGADRWNDLLDDLLTDLLGGPLPPGEPIERQVATTSLFGITFWVDVPTFSPGVIAPPALGFASLILIENFLNPFLLPTPNLITDECGLTMDLNQQGFAANAAVHRVNAGPGTHTFFMTSNSDFNADTDGLVNSDDTCPFVVNVGGNPDFDGIDTACDGVVTPTNLLGLGNPLVFDGIDADGDFLFNKGDNCVWVANGLQTDTDGDNIGDACDPSPGVPDGVFHSPPVQNLVTLSVLSLAPVCIAGGPFVDSDGDGWCDPTELGFGSDPGNPASTPEALAVPATCADGQDNDLDLATDLADGVGGPAAPTACQLPDHDIAIRKITGDAVAGGASECQPNAPTGCGYNIILRNNTAAWEGQPGQGQVGVLVDPIFGAGCSRPTVILHGGNAQPELAAGSGPISIDGDTDGEFLLIVDVTIPANGQATVNVGVVYPTCAPPAVPGTPADYIILADLCHGDDIAPLGLFASAVCGGSADGGQDRVNLANDAPVIKVINDVNR